MAFSVGNRVRVSDQNSEHRDKLGEVLSVDGDDHQIRIDGFQVDKGVLLQTNQLQTTTQACPVEY